jgi:hypothetical protein
MTNGRFFDFAHFLLGDMHDVVVETSLLDIGVVGHGRELLWVHYWDVYFLHFFLARAKHFSGSEKKNAPLLRPTFLVTVLGGFAADYSISLSCCLGTRMRNRPLTSKNFASIEQLTICHNHDLHTN